MAKPEDKTILVIDDEPDVREFLTMALEDAGFQVITAQDGNQALERLKEKIPDFISLDLVMPGKSGLRFLREMRRNQQWAHIPFVVVTAHAHDDLGRDDLQDILAGKVLSGTRVYLEKPVVPEQYVRLICERLDLEYEPESEDARCEELRRELSFYVQKADLGTLEEALRWFQKRG